MNPKSSTYQVDCECGRKVSSYEKITACEHCGRLLIIEWGNDPVVLPTAPKAKAEKEKAQGAGA